MTRRWHNECFWGAGNVLFLDPGPDYRDMLVFKKFIGLYTSSLCSKLLFPKAVTCIGFLMPSY